MRTCEGPLISSIYGQKFALPPSVSLQVKKLTPVEIGAFTLTHVYICLWCYSHGTGGVKGRPFHHNNPTEPNFSWSV